MQDKKKGNELDVICIFACPLDLLHVHWPERGTMSFVILHVQSVHIFHYSLY